MPTSTTDSAEVCSNSTHGPVTRPSIRRITSWSNDVTLVIFSIHHSLSRIVWLSHCRFRAAKQADANDALLIVGIVRTVAQNAPARRTKHRHESGPTTFSSL